MQRLQGTMGVIKKKKDYKKLAKRKLNKPLKVKVR